MLTQKSRFLGAVLLVSGTTIGAGMLALPVTTGPSGFFPSLILMLLVWLFMMLTAFYLLEINLKFPGETNLISMVHKNLGKLGAGVAWVSYLLLLYTLLAAYMVSCSQIVADLFTCMGYAIPFWIWPLLVFVLFGSFIYFGTEASDLFNRILILGLALGYIGLVALGLSHIKPELLLHREWQLVAGALPVMLTSFGYHIIIPTLTTYLHHDKKLLKKAIVLGSLIPLLVYVLWQFLAMGVIPVEGAVGLLSAASQGMQATMCLKEIIGNPYVTLAARTFAFFAIVTSLLGVSLSLKDFLADGFKIKKTMASNILLLLMTFLPPLFFALFYPRGFIMAINYASIFVVILLALIPSLMVLRQRKIKRGSVLGAVIVSIILLSVVVFS